MRLADVQAIRYGDVLVDGDRWPGFLHVVDHRQGRVLVDTGLIDSTPHWTRSGRRGSIRTPSHATSSA